LQEGNWVGRLTLNELEGLGSGLPSRLETSWMDVWREFTTHNSMDLLTCQVVLVCSNRSNDKKRGLEGGKLKIRKKLRRKSAEKSVSCVRIVLQTEQQRLEGGRRRKERVKGETQRS